MHKSEPSSSRCWHVRDVWWLLVRPEWTRQLATWSHSLFGCLSLDIAQDLPFGRVLAAQQIIHLVSFYIFPSTRLNRAWRTLEVRLPDKDLCFRKERYPIVFRYEYAYTRVKHAQSRGCVCCTKPCAGCSLTGRRTRKKPEGRLVICPDVKSPRFSDIDFIDDEHDVYLV